MMLCCSWYFLMVYSSILWYQCQHIVIVELNVICCANSIYQCHANVIFSQWQVFQYRGDRYILWVFKFLQSLSSVPEGGKQFNLYFHNYSHLSFLRLHYIINGICSQWFIDIFFTFLFLFHSYHYFISSKHRRSNWRIVKCKHRVWYFIVIIFFNPFF